MKNPDYDPDKAHLPSQEDLRRWLSGGKEKEKIERAKRERVRTKHDEAIKRRTQLLISLEPTL